MTTPPQPGIVALAYLFAVVAALLGFALARRRAEHRPVALFLGVMATIDLGRFVLAHAVDFAAAPRPHVGLVRLAFHADELGFLAWPAGLAALALVLFAERSPRPAILVWAVVGAALVALYPSDLVRGPGLQRVYLVATFAALALVIATLVGWGAKRTPPGSGRAVMFVLSAVDLARLLPFQGSIFERWSAYAPITDAVLYAVLIAVQGGFLWISPRSS